MSLTIKLYKYAVCIKTGGISLILLSKSVEKVQSVVSRLDFLHKYVHLVKLDKVCQYTLK